MFINYLCEYNKQKFIRHLEHVRLMECAVIDLFNAIYKYKLGSR